MAKLRKRRRRKGEVASRKEAIRNFCFECMGYNIAEIKRCTATECWFYPWRTGVLDKDLIEQEKQEVREEKAAKKCPKESS